MVQHCEALNRSVQVVNLDPAAEHFNYPVMAGESCTASPGTESGLLSPEGVCSWEAARGGDISEVRGRHSFRTDKGEVFMKELLLTLGPAEQFVRQC